jgi:hypothetical protein
MTGFWIENREIPNKEQKLQGQNSNFGTKRYSWRKYSCVVIKRGAVVASELSERHGRIGKSTLWSICKPSHFNDCLPHILQAH